MASLQLSQQIVRVIVEFTPRSVSPHRWVVVSPFVRAVVTEYGPSSVQGAKIALRVVGQIAAFSADCHVPLDREQVLSPSFVDRYLDHLGGSGKPDSTVGTYHSLLRSIATAVTIEAPWQPRSGRRRTNTPAPYDQGTIGSYVRNATVQGTHLRANRGLVIIGLGAGAGFRAGEMRVFEGCDLDPFGRVRVRGERERIVKVKSDLLSVLAAGLGNTRGRIFSNHKNALNDVTRRIRIDPVLPPLSIRRLRNTWIDSEIDVCTIPQLMDSTGLVSVRVIDDLLRMRDLKRNSV